MRRSTLLGVQNRVITHSTDIGSAYLDLYGTLRLLCQRHRHIQFGSKAVSSGLTHYGQLTSMIGCIGRNKNYIAPLSPEDRTESIFFFAKFSGKALASHLKRATMPHFSVNRGPTIFSEGSFCWIFFLYPVVVPPLHLLHLLFLFLLLSHPATTSSYPRLLPTLPECIFFRITNRQNAYVFHYFVPPSNTFLQCRNASSNRMLQRRRSTPTRSRSCMQKSIHRFLARNPTSMHSPLLRLRFYDVFFCWISRRKMKTF